MNVKTKILGAAMGALGLCGLSSAALAGSTNPPGERAGLDLATPLPEGVYFVDIAGVGNWRDAVTGTDPTSPTTCRSSPGRPPGTSWAATSSSSSPLRS